MGPYSDLFAWADWSVYATVVVTMASRTPLQRARKGGFKDMSVQELLIAFFKVGHALPCLWLSSTGD